MPRPPNYRVLTEALRKDDRLICFATYLPKFWIEEFGPERIRLFPISENAMLGAAIGAAVAGLHPIVHLNRASFAFSAMDQIVNQAAKLRFMSGGQVSIGVTIQAHTRGSDLLGAQHEQSPYSVFTHFPGLKVAVPSTIEDAAGLYLTSLEEPNPTLIFESPLLYSRWDQSERAVEAIPLGKALTKRVGVDATIVSVGVALDTVLQAAAELERRGVSCEVIDLCSLWPLDVSAIAASVLRTRHLLVVDDAPPTLCIGSEVVSSLLEDKTVFTSLVAPPKKLNGLRAPVPFSPALQDGIYPSVNAISRQVEALFSG